MRIIITTEEEKLPAKLVQEVSNGSRFAIHIKVPSVFTAVMLVNKNGVKLENNQQFLNDTGFQIWRKKLMRNVMLIKGHHAYKKIGGTGKTYSC